MLRGALASAIVSALLACGGMTQSDAGTDAASDAPPDAGPPTISVIGLGDNHSCALFSSHSLLCWGAADFGQLGNGATTGIFPPVSLSAGPTDISTLSISVAPYAHTCLTTESRDAYCWGDDQYGEVGDGKTSGVAQPVLTPVKISGAPAMTMVASGATHTCGLTSAGDIYCWGQSDRGECPSRC